MSFIAAPAAAPGYVVLVDVDDLEDGDIAGRLADAGAPVAGPRRVVTASPAARQAETDAVVAACTVARDRSAAVHAHRLDARVTALLA